MKTMLKKFWLEEDGGQVVEWPLVAALLAIIIIAGYNAFGTSFSDALTAIGGTLTGATGTIPAPTVP